MRLISALVIVMISGVVVVAQLDEIPRTPTPIAPVMTQVFVIPENIVDKNLVYTFLSTAVAQVNSLPDDPSFYQGVQIVPNDTATTMFGYAKWLFSGNSANELLGVSLAPVAMNLYVVLIIIVIIMSVMMTVRVVSLIIRFVTFIINWALKLIPGLG